MSTAAQRFAALDSERASMLSRFERLSELTVPSVFPQNEHNVAQDQLTNGASSLGAVAVNHLVNKMMLAMFRAGQPFFRLDVPLQIKTSLLAQLGMDESKFIDMMSSGERTAIRQLEYANTRGTLFEVLMHLVVIGNTALELGDEVRQYGVRDYVLRRSASGKPVEAVLREVVLFTDLSIDARAAVMATQHVQWDTEITLYKWIKYTGSGYKMTAWAGDTPLPAGFGGKWSEKTMPYRFLTWRLPHKQDYGVGRVEEVANDLATHESLSDALSDGAALASVFRWVVNPGGITRADEVANAPNGGFIPGAKGDVDLLFASIGQQLQTVQGIDETFVRRIGQSFLLNSAITRDAERVTTVELRMQVMELENNMGGAYSQLSSDMQQPLARWLLRKAKFRIEGTQIDPVIVTGLDALSRNADLESIKMFLEDVQHLDTLSSSVKYQLNLNAIISQFAAGRGIDRSQYVNSPEQASALQQRDMEMEMAARASAMAPAQAPQPPEM